MTGMEQKITEMRAGIVALVGAANVGKSTLMNRILGEKVSIVSPVAQTTRNVIRAILSESRGQLVFMDTPGVHRAKYDLGRLMNRMARNAVEGVDVVCAVCDVTRPPREEDEGWMRRLCRVEQDATVIMVLNKIDAKSNHTPEYQQCWSAVAKEKNSEQQPVWIETSGLTGNGVGELVDTLFPHVPKGPALFPDDILTDYPRKWNMSDVIREKYVPHLKQELPHAIAIWIESIEEGDTWVAEGTVYVDRSSQKGIVLGAKGRLLKQVERESSAELTEMYGRPVKVKLWVKVEKDWSRNFWVLRKLGYA